MSTAKFRPRDYTKSPSLFGRKPTIRWAVVGTTTEQTRVTASQIQHRVACEVRHIISASKKAPDPGDHLTRRGLTEATGISADRLTRILNGHVLMRVEDLAAISNHYGTNIADGWEVFLDDEW